MRSLSSSGSWRESISHIISAHAMYIPHSSQAWGHQNVPAGTRKQTGIVSMRAIPATIWPGVFGDESDMALC